MAIFFFFEKSKKRKGKTVFELTLFFFFTKTPILLLQLILTCLWNKDYVAYLTLS